MNKITWADLDLKEQLGAGGFGDVFRAIRTSIGDEVAVKVLRDPRNADGRLRFRREIESMLSLTHDGIVRILGYNLEENPPFLIMPLMRGGTLLAWAGKLDSPLLLSIFRHLVEVLQHIHEKGHLHRDVKPANILVAGDGTARITDFGLGNNHNPGFSMLLTQNVGGTVGYMAPELQTLLGRASRASDVYALGATMFHLITGIPPYTPPLKGLDPKLYRADVDETLRRCVLWMVHPHPGRRPSTARLLEWLGPRAPGSPAPRVPMPSKWAQGIAALGALAVVGVVVVGAAGLSSLSFRLERRRSDAPGRPVHHEMRRRTDCTSVTQPRIPKRCQGDAVPAAPASKSERL